MRGPYLQQGLGINKHAAFTAALPSVLNFLPSAATTTTALQDHSLGELYVHLLSGAVTYIGAVSGTCEWGLDVRGGGGTGTCLDLFLHMVPCPHANKIHAHVW